MLSSSAPQKPQRVSTSFQTRQTHNFIGSLLSPISTKTGSETSLGNRSLNERNLSSYINRDHHKSEVPPSLRKVTNSINKISQKLPNLFVSSKVIIDLTSHLKNIKGLIVRAEIEEMKVQELKEKAFDEWNKFTNLLSEVVAIDENENIQSFCKDQIDSLALMISSLNASITNKKSCKAQMDKVNAKFEELKLNVQENSEGLLQTLKSLLKIIVNSTTLFSPSINNNNDTQLYLDNLKQSITGMIQYIHNSNNAVESRKFVQSYARDIMKEITDLFLAAAIEEKKIINIHRLNDDDINIDKKPKRQKRKAPAKILQSYPNPKHIPASRPKLYEERRRVSAMGPLRARVPMANF